MKKLKLKFKMEGLTDDQKEALKVFQETAEFDGELTDKEIQDQVTEQLKKLGLSTEKVDSLVKQMDSDNPESLTAQVKSLNQKFDNFVADSQKKAESKEGRHTITKEMFDGLKKAIADGKNVHETEIKAADIMTTVNFFTNAPHSRNIEVDRTIYAAPAPEMVIFNRLIKTATNASQIFWQNRVNEEGGAAFIAEGALKPLKDWERAEESSVAKKVAVMSTLTTEALEDVDQLEAEVNEVLRDEVIQAVADAILNSTESATALKGIIPSATSYTTTALDDKVEAPNHADAIRAGMLQLRLLRFVPTVVFLNPGDAALLDLTKDANGQYIKVQIDSVLQKIDVVETTEIAAGKFLLMDERKWRVRPYKGLTLRWGLNADDFSHNRISVIAEMRLHSYSNSIDAGAILYGDFATIEAAILKPAA